MCGKGDLVLIDCPVHNGPAKIEETAYLFGITGFQLIFHVKATDELGDTWLWCSAAAVRRADGSAL